MSADQDWSGPEPILNRLREVLESLLAAGPDGLAQLIEMQVARTAEATSPEGME